MLIKMELNNLLAELASDSPAPGGGSVAAISGALAAGLLAMVCRLTFGKKGMEEHQEKVKTVMARADEIRANLEKLVDLDTVAFNDVMAAFKMPKGSDEENAARSKAIQAAFRQAVDVPLQTTQDCREVLSLSMEIVEIANPNCISDLGVAAQSAYAGAQGALMNVNINLPSIKDKEYVETTVNITDKLSESMNSVHKELIQIVNSRLS